MVAILASVGYESQRARLAQQRAVARVHHAYLIAGPEGVGKREIARDMAANLLCLESGPGDDACAVCDTCRRIANDNHPDVTFFSLASQAEESRTERAGTRLSVETVRAISVAAAKRPYSANMRVIIVDDVETMQGPAQEAFLKTLEEPPSFLVLLLLSDNADMLKSTILSRVERIEFLPVHPEIVERYLGATGVDDARARRISAVSLGRLGWALAAAADDSMVDEREQAFHQAASWIAASPFDRVARVFELTERGKFDSKYLADCVQSAGHIWRDLLMRRAGASTSGSLHSVLLRANLMADSFSLDTVREALASVVKCLDDLDANVRPRLALESMVMQWPTISPKQR